MREIKFRGKRLDNGEWVYGNLLKCEHKDSDSVYIIPFVTNGSFTINTLMLNFISPCYEVDPKTVGQYTGLKDKNGKEIYEGDTFSWILEDCYVGWCNECKSLQVKIIETGECMACLGDLHWYELIELLTEGKVWVNGNIEEPEGGKEE